VAVSSFVKHAKHPCVRLASVDCQNDDRGVSRCFSLCRSSKKSGTTETNVALEGISILREIQGIGKFYVKVRLYWKAPTQMQQAQGRLPVIDFCSEVIAHSSK
jgi:hypothetical protein